MARLLVLVAVALLGYLSWKRLSALPPPQRKKALLQLALLALAATLLLLVASGRLHWLGAVAAALLATAKALLPALLRMLPLLSRYAQSARPRSAPSAGESTVNTDLLAMRLDHASGKISGVVLQGVFGGRELDELATTELLALYRDCCGQDDESAQLLATYLEQRIGPNWQAGEQHAGRDASAALSREEALAILGLDDGASTADIQTAHRQLMQKLHPDRGGNDYLAAQLNRARDTLLG